MRVLGLKLAKSWIEDLNLEMWGSIKTKKVKAIIKEIDKRFIVFDIRYGKNLEYYSLNNLIIFPVIVHPMIDSHHLLQYLCTHVAYWRVGFFKSIK